MSLVELVPASDEAREQVERVLSKNLLFSNVEQFITLFNSGALDSRNTAVREASKVVLESFTNLGLLNNKFIVKTPSEEAIVNCISMLNHWRELSLLKRFATLLLNEEYPLETKVVFTVKGQGKPQVEVVDPVTGEARLESFWASEKIVKRPADFGSNILVVPFVMSYNGSEDECYFLVKDLVDIDDSFVFDVQGLISSATFRDNHYQQY